MEECLTEIIQSKFNKCCQYFDLLNEECHAFEKQYDFSFKIANEVYKNICSKKYDFISWEKPDGIIFNVLIKNAQLESLCVAEIGNFNAKVKTATLAIFIDTIFLCYLTKQQIIQEIAASIAHEIMHCHIFIKRSENYQEINDAPSNYQTILKILSELNADSDEYYFTYGLYILYYQEAQAIISQAWPELKEILDQYDIKEIKIKELKDNIPYINSYRAFSKALLVCKRIQKNIAINKRMKLFVVKYNLFPIASFNKIVKQLENKSQKALQKILSNCYYYAVKEGYLIDMSMCKKDK